MPTFDKIEDAVLFMNEQIGLMDARILKLEGENMALRVAAQTMWSVLANDPAKEFFREHADRQIETFRLEYTKADPNTKKLIDALMDATRAIWTDAPTDEVRSFTVIKGGRND